MMWISTVEKPVGMRNCNIAERRVETSNSCNDFVCLGSSVKLFLLCLIIVKMYWANNTILSKREANGLA